jgi:hypothetical protein
MAKVETRVLPKEGNFTGSSEIVRALRGAIPVISEMNVK